MSQTRPETSEELLEAIQNTDPTSDPADDITTGVEGTERTAGTAAPYEPMPSWSVCAPSAMRCWTV